MAAAIITRLMFGKTDVIQMLNGAIGLVAVTAEPLAPSPLAAIFIGAVGGLIVVFGTKLLLVSNLTMFEQFQLTCLLEYKYRCR